MDVMKFWKDVLAQNREALPSYFAENAIIRWPCTGEQFTVSEYIDANCLYPGTWDGEVERCEQLGELTVTVTHVYPTDHSTSFHAVSLIEMKDEKIVRMDEYWSDDGEAPDWRNKVLPLSRTILIL